MEEPTSLQERHAPTNRCFGCGPANEKGLRIRSFEQDDEVVCTWQPQRHHEAWENMLNDRVSEQILYGGVGSEDEAVYSWIDGLGAH